MASRDDRLYRCVDPLLVRVAIHGEFALPAWPRLGTDSPERVCAWLAWLREVWALDGVAAAVEHASPSLARDLCAIFATPTPAERRVRRAVLSLARYLLRMTGRATPFGLFAGVAPASFASEPSVSWRPGHRAVARADASWIVEVISQLESRPEILERLALVANNVAFVRGDRVVVPYPPRRLSSDGDAEPAEVSLRATRAVRHALHAARGPARGDELVCKLTAEFPSVGRARAIELIGELVTHGVLISSLHAPSTSVDAFGWLLHQLATAEATDVPAVAGLVSRLEDVSDVLERHNLERHNLADSPEAGRRARRAFAENMATLVPSVGRPVAVDVRADCSVALPAEVAREAEAATAVLARLSAYPFGTPAWQAYHERFFERYGIGSLVPLLDVVDPDAGLGFPAGYISGEPEVREPVTERDRKLLALAQEAAVERRDEVVLNDGLVATLAGPDQRRAQVPPHLELRFQVHASSLDDLARGQFELWDVSPSRGAGTIAGRSLGLLGGRAQARAATMASQLPTLDAGAVPVQLSFPPLDPRDAHVTRAPEVLAGVISIAEHRPPGGNVTPLDDLAVGCDRRRLYLASISRVCRLEPAILHALDLRAHTPPLARFLVELGRAQSTVVTAFDWGAASCLPFLPRVRFGRTILAPARWRLDRSILPSGEVPWSQWTDAVTAWRHRYRVPADVLLIEGDQRLRLDLDEDSHLALLHAHLASADTALLTEAPAREALGWLGGRAHEVVVPMMSTAVPREPRQPSVAAAPVVVRRGDGHVPGASRCLHAKLYGQTRRQPDIVAHWLPDLLAGWDEPPEWWFIRYRDPEPHLRLRIALAEPDEFGPAARRVGAWAARLRRHGLLREVQFATSYQEEGRWGRGEAMAAAEAVFAADSRALAVQFAHASSTHPQALAAANFTRIACGFAGSTDAGMAWLLAHARTAAGPALPRPVLADAVQLADPSGAALRASTGGPALAEAWAARDRALATYRGHLRRAGDVDEDLIVESLLHTHHIRAVGIDKEDERTCVRLARAAALAWKARNRRGRP